MKRALMVALVAVAAAAYAPAFAGARIGGSSSAANAGNLQTYGTPNVVGGVRPEVAPLNWTVAPQVGHPLGNSVYLNNGMVVPRSTNYFFTWQGRPCQTLNSTTFCR
ncbi:MAG: hypothetical protein JOY64_04925 [Alphaproteobacteria bacterium]|nr:hypothetical protein [Alphaproteobacteria bacterium]